MGYAHAGIGTGLASARSKQQQWKNVALKVQLALGFPKVNPEIVNVQEFDYNVTSNKFGTKEAEESFTEEFSSQFPTKK